MSRSPLRQALSALACATLLLDGAIAAAQSPPAGPPPGGTATTNGTATTPAAAPTATQAPTGPTPDAVAKADALFEEARKLMEQKDFDAACPKLEESQRLDPAPKTLFNLAKCEGDRGRFVTAGRRWKEALALLPADDPRRSVVEDNIAASEKNAYRVQLRLPAKPPPGMTVTLDDHPLTAAELAATIAVDAGAHRIVISAPGHESRTIPFAATSGTPQDIPLTPGPEIPESSPKGTVAPSVPVAPPSSFLDPARHKVSLSLFGGGVAVAGVGVGLAVDILSRYHSFVVKCTSPAGCTENDKSNLANEATATTVLFTVAGAAAATAVILAFTVERDPSQPARPQGSLSIGPTGAVATLTY